MPKPKNARFELTDLDIIEMAFCKNPIVPEATFQLLKAKTEIEDDRELILKGSEFIIKSSQKKQVFLYALVPDSVDHEDTTVSIENVEKAAHSYLKNMAFRAHKADGTSLEHQVFGGNGHIIESIIDHDGSIGKSLGFPKPISGAWLVGFQITNDTIWKSIETGELTGISIGGIGKLSSVSKSDPGEDKTGQKWKIAIANSVNEILGLVSKADDAKSFSEALQERNMEEEFWTIFGALRESIQSIINDDELEDKSAALKTTIDEFAAAVLTFVGIAKAGAEFNQANVALIEEVHSALEVISKLQKKISAVRERINNKTNQTNKSDNGGDGMSQLTEEKVKEMIAEAITKANEGLVDQVGKAVKDALDANIEEIKKAANSSTDDNANDDADSKKEATPELVEQFKALEAKVDKVLKAAGVRKSDDDEASTKKKEVKKGDEPKRSQFGAGVMGNPIGEDE